VRSKVLVDTGPIVAMFSESDSHHRVCVEELKKIDGPLLTCWPVLTEVAWLLRAHLEAIRRLLSTFGGKPFQILPLHETELADISAILVKYKNLNIQLADAALLHLANRESISTVFTLDRRDFGTFRLSQGKTLRLIPKL
jgi:predicted nucleic acid-binding protein